MHKTPEKAIAALDRRFLMDHPWQAAQKIEEMPGAAAAEALSVQPADVLVPVMMRLTPNVAAELLRGLPDALTVALLSEMLPHDALRLLGLFDDSDRSEWVARLDPAISGEIRRLMRYPEDSAGRLMDCRVTHLRGTSTVGQTLQLLRKRRTQATRSLFLVDAENRLSGKVRIQDVAVSDPDTELQSIATAVTATVTPVTSQAEVVELLERHQLADLPVVDIDGRLLGVIYHAALLHAIQEDSSADIQMMVGASKDERALSPPLFAVRKRLPWLQINLLTAFMAAAVVGLFEDTIARFTALAVLLPVVAGQSGNAGAQALAVTMRGLALREITVRHVVRVTLKEVNVGLVNGLAVALSCGIGVYAWSGSFGLVLVIAASMVLAMIAAGFAGAVVPIALTRLGQDPAQSSSIVLTTVTDIAGFFSFLGIATLLAALL
ncbi:MAG TPA: magnesium transporter [Woeseiaceae bacterium]|nr:magnesium transporter [Woeseiaceae bacterium]